VDRGECAGNVRVMFECEGHNFFAFCGVEARLGTILPVFASPCCAGAAGTNALGGELNQTSGKVPPPRCVRFVYTVILRLFVFCACFSQCLITHFQQRNTLWLAKEVFVSGSRPGKSVAQSVGLELLTRCLISGAGRRMLQVEGSPSNCLEIFLYENYLAHVLPAHRITGEIIVSTHFTICMHLYTYLVSYSCTNMLIHVCM